MLFWGLSIKSRGLKFAIVYKNLGINLLLGNDMFFTDKSKLVQSSLAFAWLSDFAEFLLAKKHQKLFLSLVSQKNAKEPRK